VARVSSNYDKEISRIVYEALYYIGNDGVIDIEAGGRVHELKIINGS